MIEFSIAACPMPMNAWRKQHWSVRAREQKLWATRMAVARLTLPMTSRACVSPAIVTLTFTAPRRRDPDGLAKCVLDGLVFAGLIADDGPPHLVELRLRSERGKPAETRVRIEEA